MLGARSVAHSADQGDPPSLNPPAHSKQRTHSTREQTAQPGRCRAINVQLDEVNDGYSAAETDHRSCSGGPAPGPRSMLPSRLCGSLPADPSLTPTGPHEPPSGQPRSPCFTLHPGANRLLLAPSDLMVGVLSACYTRRPQGVTHGQSRCTVRSVRRRVGRDPPQIPKLTVGVRFPSPAPHAKAQVSGLPLDLSLRRYVR